MGGCDSNTKDIVLVKSGRWRASQWIWWWCDAVDDERKLFALLGIPLVACWSCATVEIRCSVSVYWCFDGFIHGVAGRFPIIRNQTLAIFQTDSSCYDWALFKPFRVSLVVSQGSRVRIGWYEEISVRLWLKSGSLNTSWWWCLLGLIGKPKKNDTQNKTEISLWCSNASWSIDDSCMLWYGCWCSRL